MKFKLTRHWLKACRERYAHVVELRRIANIRDMEKPMPLSKRIQHLTQNPEWLIKYKGYIKKYLRKSRKNGSYLRISQQYCQNKLLDDFAVEQQDFLTFIGRFVRSKRRVYTATEFLPILTDIFREEISTQGTPEDLMKLINWKVVKKNL